MPAAKTSACNEQAAGLDQEPRGEYPSRTRRGIA
jgi:hypothetical protein